MAKTTRYTRQETVAKATHLFWHRGFHATSMRNIQESIDMRPGSIYSSFGSKEGLFKESLQFYTDSSLSRLANHMESSSPLEALTDFIKSSVLSRHDSAPSDMCMLVKTVSELTQDNADLLDEAKRLIGTVEDAFAALFAQAQKCGEIDKTKDPQQLARFLQVQIMGFRSYAQVNNGYDDLNQLIDETVAYLSL
jgi:TetR/AcrR family transcriptional repressor of nem operon